MSISSDTRETITGERGFYYDPAAIVDTIIGRRKAVMNIEDLRDLAFLVASHEGGEITPGQLTGSLADLAKLDKDNPVVNELLEALDLDTGDLSEWKKDFNDSSLVDRREAVEGYVEEVLITMLEYHDKLDK